ncbi:Uncharacterised protein [Acholeplasma oculi]|uniref:Prokaryotic membrane lipoprotein lipid attachment site profile n=1 Tax=Acholeplasma oculi TaxID=35623 RepID=A0A061AAS3_9MOLU|nr:hypothetical protein [Acholeplasma oculi]CDR30494.1 hypothetical protein Aocu_04210 [Acholeplasma oculi]SKC48026.1 hypothetical protein SAMN02745122_1329 [Acholeplasma oculi]SUT89127.1 Uncharacterised protein [Acholeplasma oculi]
MLTFLGLILALTLVACSGTNSNDGSQNDYFSKVLEEYDKKIEAIEKENGTSSKHYSQI